MSTAQEFILTVLKENSATIIWIVILFFFGKIALKLIVNRFINLVDDGDDEHDSQKEKRAATVGHVVMIIGNIVIYIVLLLMILILFGVDIRPILAGAGVVGLAVGFGTQALVKDFVSGFFILIENQYDIGDRIKIGSFEGTVSRITMRSTVLQDTEGKTYYTPNGSISNVVNFSQKDLSTSDAAGTDVSAH